MVVTNSVYTTLFMTFERREYIANGKGLSNYGNNNNQPTRVFIGPILLEKTKKANNR